MRDLFVLIVLLAFILPGLTRPYLAFAGYLWVDTVVPQSLTFGFLRGQPVSMVMALACFLSLFIGAKNLSSPKSKGIAFLFFFFILWITLTTLNAQFSIYAWRKWDFAFKTLLMAFLLMFTITTRKQLELVVLTLLLSLMFYMFSAGPKTLLGGGGYGATLGLSTSNSGWNESSTLSCLAVLTLPLLTYARKHISLVPFVAKSDKLKNIIWLGSGVLCIGTVIGTTARTGLVALVGYFGLNVLRFRFSSIIKIIPVALMIAGGIYFAAPESWFQRMTTVENPTDNSASARVAVWKWTIDYVSHKPIMGGGFNSFVANRGQLGMYSNAFDSDSNSLAFHSIYFEILGEQGYVGLFTFLGLILGSVRINRSLRKRADTDQKTKDLSLALNHTIFLFCIGGAFIGIAFKPIIYHLIAISVAHHTIIHKELIEQNNHAKKL